MTKTKAEHMSYCIHSFMSDEMGLGGGELLVFAIIYSFSKGDGGIFYGTQSFLSRASGLSVSTVKRSLSSLLNKSYIKKGKHGERDGYIAVADEYETSLEQNTNEPSNDAEVEISEEEGVKTLSVDIRGRLCDSVKRPKYVFHSVGRDNIVSMTAEQYKRLLMLVDEETLTGYVRRLELLIKNKGYKTFSPYKTIKRWILEDVAV